MLALCIVCMRVSEVEVVVLSVEVIQLGFLLLEKVTRLRGDQTKKKQAMHIFKMYQYITHTNVYTLDKITRRCFSQVSYKSKIMPNVVIR